MPADRLLHPRCSKSHKVSLLTDLEFRVWIQYLLSADDFGVMRGTPLEFQGANDYLANRKVRELQRCIDAVVKSKLVGAFTHQGKPYLYQHDWQAWQKVEFPRATDNPKPPADVLEQCDAATRLLFDKHPGGKRKQKGDTGATRADNIPNDSERASRTHADHFRVSDASDVRLTANGLRPEANGLRQTAEEAAPMDEWARELVNLYDPRGRCAWNLVERPLFDVLTADPTISAWVAWDRLKARLEQHKRSHQWRVKGMVSRLDRWLREGAHLQELSETAPAGEQLSPKTQRMMSAAAQAMKESA